jgi:uncharacterized protein (DUF488 family)
VTAEPERFALYTIGHSNHTFEKFLDLLKKHAIGVLVDVRSQPYSKYTPYFDADVLKKHIPDAGLKYLFMGKELGGRPEGTAYYDGDGHVLYSRMAQSDVFLEGISRLEHGSRACRVAIFCSEEDPTSCHRRLLISRVMRERGFQIAHIRGDGRVQTEEELAAEEELGRRDAGQLTMFEVPEEERWKSTRSVSPRKPQPNSSEH